MSNTRVCSQCGGAYTVDIADMVAAGMPVIQSYSDCAPPVIVDHKISNSRCNQTGGKNAKKSSKNSTRKSSRKTLKKSSKRSSKKSSKRSSKRSSKKQKGGNPGKYPFDGKTSEHSADMSKRTFGCRQPDWEPTCV